MSEEQVKLEVGFAEGLEEKASPVLEPIKKLLDRLNVDSVFGKPTREGELTIIPVAEVSVGFGYGYGAGPAGMPEEEIDEGMDIEEEEEEEGALAGGGGGGAGGKAKPVGYLKIGPDGVEYESIVDESRVAIAGIALGAWTIFWLGRVLKGLIDAVAARRTMEIELEE